MSKKLSCEQIEALIIFYAEGTLHTLLRKSVAEHLEICPECMNRYLELVKLLNNTNENKPIETKQYEAFKNNLSAYIDNELDNEENIKIKKFAISNQQARQELENMINFKKLLHSSFEKTKNEIKNDYSKSITAKVQQELNISAIDPFYKIAIIFICIIGIIISGFITILYFHSSGII